MALFREAFSSDPGERLQQMDARDSASSRTGPVFVHDRSVRQTSACYDGRRPRSPAHVAVHIVAPLPARRFATS